MDGQKSQSKLTRTQSSFLRSSPTVRSSIHSFTSISSTTQDQEAPDVEEQKPHTKKQHGPNPVRTGLAPVLAVLILSIYTIFLFLSVPTSESLLLALIFVAVLLFLVSRNKSMVNQNLIFCKHWCEKCGKRLNLWRFSGSKNSHKPVQWFIGEPSSKTEVKGKINISQKAVKEGVEFYSNGDFYEGEFHKGKCNGSGVYNYFVNGRYEGDWIDGRYDGYGIESWAKGSRYKGQYRQGLRHGYGVYKFYTGDSYSGEWCHGQSHGIGVQTCADGSCYVGEFKCGVKHGLGCYHFRNGDRYSGEYFTDRPHGFGIYHFSNGHYYEGSWHEGRKQGYGMYTFSNGESQCGEWDCGNLKTTLSPRDEAVVKAVQAARRTSESAVHVGRVDERVNKAVTAANRASTAARVAAVKAVQNRINGRFCDTDI